MNIWLVFDGLLDTYGESKIIGAYSNEAAADAYRESLMTRVEGLPPWDNAYVEMHEVHDNFSLSTVLSGEEQIASLDAIAATVMRKKGVRGKGVPSPPSIPQ